MSATAPAVQPVPGTDAARRAAEHAAKTLELAAGARPHVVLDPDLAGRPESPKRRGLPPGMSAVEAADRIVAVLLQGTGPILLTVPGTLGGLYQTSMLATARAVARLAAGSVSIAAIPYPNGVFDVVTRYFRIGVAPEDNVLAHVLRKLRAAAPHRPVLLAGESQGAWLIADTLRDDSALAAAVTRVVLFAKPGFVEMPDSIGTARTGAGMLPTTSRDIDGVVSFAHTDDIVPSLFRHLGPHVLRGYVDSLLAGRGFAYTPHHYDWHDDEAARWLLDGVPPDRSTIHDSRTHPAHRPGSGFS